MRFEEDIFNYMTAPRSIVSVMGGSNVGGLLCVVFFYVCMATEIFDVILCSAASVV